MSPFYLSHTYKGLGLKMKLETESDHFCTLFFCTGLTSAAELRRTVLSGKLPCCLLDAGMICSSFQVMVAVNKAVINLERKKLVTKSLQTEIIYSLSPSTNISESLRLFGAKDDSNSVVAVFTSDSSDSFLEQEESLKSLVKGLGGEVSQDNDFSKTLDLESLKKVYQITEKELQVTTLEKAVTTAMSMKHLV